MIKISTLAPSSTALRMFSPVSCFLVRGRKYDPARVSFGISRASTGTFLLVVGAGITTATSTSTSKCTSSCSSTAVKASTEGTGRRSPSWLSYSTASPVASLESSSLSPVSLVRNTRLPSRDDQIKRLREASSREKALDVIVVGGGATGCGVALDAATRNLSTALIERGDFGNETSARSTKLIWAGIRYIATALASLLRTHNLSRPVQALNDFVGEFRMVLGAHKERRIMLENNPHLTNWVPIAIPMSSWISWPPPFGHPLFATAPLTLPLVMKFYDSLSGFTCPPSHIMGLKRAYRKFPQLDQHSKYFQIFYEGQHNDSRTATYLALTSAEYGAITTNYVEMISIITEKDNSTDPTITNSTKTANTANTTNTPGRAIGITCRDNRTNQTFDVYAKAIIFAGGPFTDELRKLEDPHCQPAVAASAGTHIVLPGYYSPGGIGMLDINTSDGRFLFFLPWEGSTLVGTTDRKGPVTSYHGPPEEEIQWLLNEVQKYLATSNKIKSSTSTNDIDQGGFEVRRSDVLSAWQGFRPLASDPHAVEGAPVSRDHIISTNPTTGITFITGGKWVTYREMAQDVLDRVIALNRSQLSASKTILPCQTEHIVLRGGVGYNRNVPIQLVQKYEISETIAKHLARNYGTHAFDVCELMLQTSNNNTKSPSTSNPINTYQSDTALTDRERFGVLVEGYPYLACEVIYQCRHEMCCSVSDMVALRMRLAYLNKNAALRVVPRVAEIMSHELKWSPNERKRQIQQAIDLIQTFGGPTPTTSLKTDNDTNNESQDKESSVDKISDRIKLSAEKLGSGTESRGAGFG